MNILYLGDKEDPIKTRGTGLSWYSHNILKQSQKMSLNLNYTNDNGIIYKKVYNIRSFMRNVDSLEKPIVYSPDCMFKHLPFFTYASLKKVPVIATIHDLQSLAAPYLIEGNGERIRKKRILSIRLLSKVVDAVITPSNFSKWEISYYSKIPEQKIFVLSNGVDHTKFKNLDKDLSKKIIEDAYGVKNPYVLYVGGAKKRLLDDILLAIKKIRTEQTNDNIVAVFAGPKSMQEYVRVAAAIQGLRIGKDVWILGYVSEKNLPTLYNASKAFIFPSYHEGFGLPILEAMACGTPVIAYDIPAISEIFGEAFFHVSTHNYDHLSEAIVTLMQNDNLINYYTELGLEKAKHFSWQRTVEGLIDILKTFR